MVSYHSYTSYGHTASQWLGLLRSLWMYHGNPLTTRRLSRLYGQFIESGDLCFDIGCHVGSHTSLWLRMGARVVAVEPQPQCMQFLRRRFRADQAVTLIESAVGSTAGRGVFLVSRRTPTVSTMRPEWIEAVRRDAGFSKVRWDAQAEVDVVTLDALIGRFGLPAFCKIDVEGSEPFVLKGLSSPVPVITFEYVCAAMDRALACLQELGRLGVYEYNLMEREGKPLYSDVWLTESEITERLTLLSGTQGSGDVFARIIS